MTDHDQQYLVELDGNLTPNTIFQQLVTKLETYVLRRAAVPMRLQNPDEEELPDEIETVRDVCHASWSDGHRREFRCRFSYSMQENCVLILATAPNLYHLNSDVQCLSVPSLSKCVGF